ncbi:uncharacterized protein PAC_10624 [Phialocephala subalpina]|uniref:2EXR domain-containing protein n=1 Tax=Phialocephala subalpina TaxID=576137 RepID=A0A1L7X6U0_9HELO|nr:uncharacterized protein PAC_10624 [Phialocephala subalpina]
MPASKIDKFFNNLPTELRLRIWKKAAFIPRNVDVWNREIFIGKNNQGTAYAVSYRMISRTPPPAILHVCRESRAEGLKYYMLEFGTTKDFRDFVITSKPKIYINPAVDTVCLPRPQDFLQYPMDDTEDVESYGKALDFRSRLGKMKLRSLAINVFDTPLLDIDDFTSVSMYGSIMPTSSNTVEQLILFSDPSSYDGEPRPLQERHNIVNFRKLSQQELDSEHITVGDLVHGLELLNAYFARDFDSPERIAKYHSWKKSLRKMDCRWEEVDIIDGLDVSATAYCLQSS